MPLSPGEKRTPCFFFSYARRDDFDPYLKRFFDNLCEEVALRGGRSRKAGEVSFRDVDDIEPGQDWEDELASALQASEVLLCLFTTSYFQREYCGKEFQVFLDRQPEVRFEDGAARGSRRIVSILWLDIKDLTRDGPLPRLVQFIEAVPAECPPQYRDRYQDRGLRWILKKGGRRGYYQDILDRLVDILLDLAMERLDPLPERPRLGRIRSAFHPVPPGMEGEPGRSPAEDGFAGASGPGGDRPLESLLTGEGRWDADRPAGPHRLVLLALVAQAVPARRGAAGEEGDPLRRLDRSAARQGFDPEVIPIAAAQRLAPAFHAAAQRGALPVAVLPWQGEATTALLQELGSRPGGPGGVLVLTNGASSPQVEAQASVLADRLVVRAAAGGQEEAVFEEMLPELMRRRVRGQVHRKGAGSGPDTNPAVQGPGSRISSD